VPGPENAPHAPSGAHPSSGAHAPSGAHSAAPPLSDAASAVVRWAAFSCVLVPMVLAWYGTSLAGAAGTALGLAAVTGACQVLLRQSERGAARLRAEKWGPHRGRHGRVGPSALGAWHGGRGPSGLGGGHGRRGTGAHRGGRQSGGSKPVD